MGFSTWTLIASALGEGDRKARCRKNSGKEGGTGAPSMAWLHRKQCCSPGGCTVLQTGTQLPLESYRQGLEPVHLFSHKTNPHYFLCPVGQGVDTQFNPESPWAALVVKQWRSTVRSAFAENVREHFKIQIAYENLIWHSSTWKLVLNQATTSFPEEIIYPEKEEFASLTL